VSYFLLSTIVKNLCRVKKEYFIFIFLNEKAYKNL